MVDLRDSSSGAGYEMKVYSSVLITAVTVENIYFEQKLVCLVQLGLKEEEY